MKNANKLILRPLLIFCSLSGPLTALATDSFKRFPRDFWEFQASTKYFRTEANYTSVGGSYSKLPAGQYFQQIDMDFGTRYVKDSNLAFYGNVGVGNAESKDAGSTRQNSSLRDVSAGIEYLSSIAGLEFIPELELVVPLESYDQNTDSVMITEGVIEARSKVTVQKDFTKINSFAYVGFTVRDQERSYLLPYGVGAEWKLDRSRLGLELSGYMSITDDKDTENKSPRIAISDRVNGGSLYHSSVNPSITELMGYYKFRMGNTWVAHLGAGTTLTGANAAAGFSVVALLRYSFDTSSWYKSNDEVIETVPEALPAAKSKMYQSPISSDSDVQRFQEQYDDGVDQKIFRQTSPTTAPKLPAKKKKKAPEAEVNVKLRPAKKPATRP